MATSKNFRLSRLLVKFSSLLLTLSSHAILASNLKFTNSAIVLGDFVEASESIETDKKAALQALKDRCETHAEIARVHFSKFLSAVHACKDSDLKMVVLESFSEDGSHHVKTSLINEKELLGEAPIGFIATGILQTQYDFPEQDEGGELFLNSFSITVPADPYDGKSVTKGITELTKKIHSTCSAEISRYLKAKASESIYLSCRLKKISYPSSIKAIANSDGPGFYAEFHLVSHLNYSNTRQEDIFIPSFEEIHGPNQRPMFRKRINEYPEGQGRRCCLEPDYGRLP